MLSFSPTNNVFTSPMQIEGFASRGEDAKDSIPITSFSETVTVVIEYVIVWAGIYHNGKTKLIIVVGNISHKNTATKSSNLLLCHS